MLLDGVEDGGGVLAVERMEGVADGVDADPVAGALVADSRSEAAGVGRLARGGASEDIGAGAGDGEDAGAAVKGGVEGDLVVSGEDQGAGGQKRGKGAGGPLADERDGDAGQTDAGGVNVGEGDAGEGGDVGEEIVEAAGGEVFADAKDLDGAGAGAGEGAGSVREETFGLGATGVEG